jgi:hypothetical protein
MERRRENASRHTRATTRDARGLGGSVVSHFLKFPAMLRDVPGKSYGAEAGYTFTRSTPHSTTTPALQPV